MNSLRRFIIIIVTFAYLHVCLVVLLLLEILVLVILFGLVEVVALIARFFLTILIVHHIGLLDEFIVLFHFGVLPLELFLLVLVFLVFSGGMVLSHVGVTGCAVHLPN